MLGALVSSVFAYYALKKQDERRFKHAEEEQKKQQLRRRNVAYRQLEAIREVVFGRSKVGETVRWLTGVEYETLQSIISQDFDVLDNSTVAAWDTRGMVRTPYTKGDSTVEVVCEAFWADVAKHYDRIKFSAIPSSS